jgi:hypothetical protein
VSTKTLLAKATRGPPSADASATTSCTTRSARAWRFCRFCLFRTEPIRPAELAMQASTQAAGSIPERERAGLVRGTS